MGRIVILAGAVLVAAGGGFGLAYAALQPEDNKEGTITDVLQEELDQLNRKIEEAQEEIEELDDQRQTTKRENEELETESRSLQRQLDELTEKIRDLEDRREELSAWLSAGVMLYNQGQHAVGLRKSAGKYKLVAKGEGASAANQACKSMFRAQQYLFVHVDELTSEVFHDFEVEDVVNDEISNQLNELVRAANATGVGAVGLQFVEYIESSTGVRGLGTFQGADSSAREMMLGTIAGEETVPAREILPGYARKRTEREILADLSDADFLDFCLLRVSQYLQRSAASERLALHCRVIVPQDPLDELFADAFAAFLGEGERTSQDRFAGKLEQTIYTRLSQVPNVQLLKDDFVLDAMADSDLFTRLIEHFVLGIEDDGEAQRLRREKRDHVLASLRATTHYLTIEIRPPTDPLADYHIWVALYDLRGRHHLVWSTEGDRQKSGSFDQYFLQSGTLTQAAFNDGDSPALEQPPVIQPGAFDQVVDTKRSRRSGLIIVEAKNDETLWYRKLFGNELLEVPMSQVIGLTEFANHEDAGDRLPMPDRIRYTAWRLSQAVLAPAAIINPDAGNVLPIGQVSGLEAGNRLRVVRHDRNDVDAIKTFGTELYVDDCYAGHINYSVNYDSGLPELFPDDNYVPEFGDIAYRAEHARHVIVELGAIQFGEFLNADDAIRCGYRNANRRLQLDTRAGTAIKLLRQSLFDALSRQGIAVYDPQAVTSGGNWTHQVSGIVHFLGPREGTRDPRGLTVRLEARSKVNPDNTVSVNVDLPVPRD